jgi:hypothetical protein
MPKTSPSRQGVMGLSAAVSPPCHTPCHLPCHYPVICPARYHVKKPCLVSRLMPLCNDPAELQTSARYSMRFDVAPCHGSACRFMHRMRAAMSTDGELPHLDGWTVGLDLGRERTIAGRHRPGVVGSRSTHPGLGNAETHTPAAWMI